MDDSLHIVRLHCVKSYAVSAHSLSHCVHRCRCHFKRGPSITLPRFRVDKFESICTIVNVNQTARSLLVWVFFFRFVLVTTGPGPVAYSYLSVTYGFICKLFKHIDRYCFMSVIPWSTWLVHAPPFAPVMIPKWSSRVSGEFSYNMIVLRLLLEVFHLPLVKNAIGQFRQF